MQNAIDLVRMYWPGTDQLPFDASIEIPAWDNSGDVICHVGLMDREILIDGWPKAVGGIGYVCTREDYRHMGLMHTAMNIAHLKCRVRGLPFTILNTGLNGLYEPLGYKRVSNLPPEWMVKELDDLVWPEDAVVDLQGTW